MAKNGSTNRGQVERRKGHTERDGETEIKQKACAACCSRQNFKIVVLSKISAPPMSRQTAANEKERKKETNEKDVLAVAVMMATATAMVAIAASTEIIINASTRRQWHMWHMQSADSLARRHARCGITVLAFDLLRFDVRWFDYYISATLSGARYTYTRPRCYEKKSLMFF